MSDATHSKSLDGIRVMDFSWVMAGPMATKMLGAMGAEVIKIESSSRPEFSDRGGMFSVINNNKRSTSVNITTPEGQALLHDLVRQADVVVENFSSRVLEKYGLSYEHMRKLRPDVIFVSASGLGRQGPQRDYLAYGSLLQGYSGRVSMIGELNPYLEAMGILPAWTDPITAMWEVNAILAALHHRRRTGEGSYIDLSMLESTVALLPVALIESALGRPEATSREPASVPPAVSACIRCAGRDNWLALTLGSDAAWRGLVELLERPELLDRFPDLAACLVQRDALRAALAPILREMDAEQLAGALRQRGIPAGHSRNIADMVHDDHLNQRGVFQWTGELPHMATLPWRWEDGWRGDYAPSPELGSANDYVFGELLKIPQDERDRLVAEGVIG